MAAAAGGSPRGWRARTTPRRAGLSSAAAASLAGLPGIGLGGLLGARRRRGGLAQHEKILAAVHTRQRPRRDAREHLARVALDVEDLGDRKVRRIRAVDAGGEQPIAHA